MYSKCGALAEAHDVFDDMPGQDVVVWNALLAGYACQGHNEVVLYLFERMKLLDVFPNSITFLSILTVCSHAGLVLNGQKYFDMMGEEYDLPLTIEHYNCMVDLCRCFASLTKTTCVYCKTDTIWVFSHMTPLVSYALFDAFTCGDAYTLPI